MSYIVGRGRYAREGYPSTPAGGGGSSSVVGNIISVPTTPALTAHSTAGLTTGALATITQRFSLYSYQPADVHAPDGYHVPAAGGGNWVYEGPTDAPSRWAQTVWTIDPANSTGLASEDNTGLSAASPLLTKAEMVRRCSDTPQADGINVTINQLSSDTGDSDPLVWHPIKKNGGSYTYTAPFPTPSFTGSLNAVTPKSYVAPGNALASTFTTTTGAIAADMLLINTTRASSRALAQRNLGAGNWQLTQPQAPFAGSGFDIPAENDTWANGDAITGYVPITVNLRDVSSIGDQTNNDVIWRITVPNLSGVGEILVLGAQSQISDSILMRGVLSATAYLETGVAQHGGGNSLNGNEVLIFGGWQSCDFGSTSNMIPSNDVIIGNEVQVIGINGQFVLGTHATHVCIDGTFGVAWVPGNGAPNGFGVGVIYGSGTFNTLRGTLWYDNAIGAGVNQFRCTIEMNGQSIGYSRVTAAGVTTIHGGIALTGANLDAAAGAAGFGGYAEGGGAIMTNGAQP